MKRRFFISLKMTGLLTGLLTWGWRGMLIGFLLGYLLDKRLEHWLSAAPSGDKRRRSKDDTLFFQLTFQMLGFLAKADGTVSPQEIQTVEQIISSMALSADDRQAAIEAFNLGKNQPEPPITLIRAFRTRFRHRTGKKAEWLHYQFQLLYAEGRADTQRVEMLGMNAFYAGISAEQFQTLRQQYRKAWQYKHHAYRGHEQRGQDNSDRFSQHHSRRGRNDHDRASQEHTHQEQTHQEQTHQEHTYKEHAYKDWTYRTYTTNPERELYAAYQLLGLTPDADRATLKKAYRQKISKVHPDKIAGKNASAAEQARAKDQSQQLQAAY